MQSDIRTEDLTGEKPVARMYVEDCAASVVGWSVEQWNDGRGPPAPVPVYPMLHQQWASPTPHPLLY